MKPDYTELFFSKTQEFLDVYLLKQAGRSKQTIKAYKYSLFVFFEYISKHKNINPAKFTFNQCTHDLILEYSGYLQSTKHNKPSTVNQRLAALKSYAKYAADGNMSLVQMYISVESVPFLKTQRSIKEIIPKDALAYMLDIPDTSKFSIRDRTILILLFDSAVRVSELVSLKIGNLILNTENPHLYVTGKGNKERIIGLSSKTVSHIQLYLQKFHADNNNPEAPLFYTIIKGKPGSMSTRNVERIVDKYAEITRVKFPELPKEVYPHMMRRTRATGLYQDGVPLEMVSRILGHRFIETTKIYASPSIEQLRERIEKNSSAEPEAPLWKGHEAELARKFGLK